MKHVRFITREKRAAWRAMTCQGAPVREFGGGTLDIRSVIVTRSDRFLCGGIVPSRRRVTPPSNGRSPRATHAIRHQGNRNHRSNNLSQ